MEKPAKVCRLCFSLTPAESTIGIFDETGKMLNVASIVSQHFWFRVSTQRTARTHHHAPTAAS